MPALGHTLVKTKQEKKCQNIWTSVQIKIFFFYSVELLFFSCLYQKFIVKFMQPKLDFCELSLFSLKLI